MMKLTAAQQKVMNEAVKDIEEARSFETFEDCFMSSKFENLRNIYGTLENYKQKRNYNYNHYRKSWENAKVGIVKTWCHSGTIRKLEKLGLIEIIKDSAKTGSDIDLIKVL